MTTKQLDCTRKHNQRIVNWLGWTGLVACRVTPQPPQPKPEPPQPEPPQPQPDPQIPVPVKLAHGKACDAPMSHRSSEPYKSRGEPRGGEDIHSKGPFNDIRVLCVNPDVFLDKWALQAVRIENGYVVGDDIAHEDCVYEWQVFNAGTWSNNTTTNPVRLADISKGTFRVRWKCYQKV
jgi:hypothetical protein